MGADKTFMNQKGFSIVEVLVSLGLLGVITYYSVQGMDQVTKVNRHVEADVNASFLLQETQEVLSRLGACKQIMSGYIPVMNATILNAHNGAPFVLDDFQTVLDPYFNSTEVKGILNKIQIHEAKLFGNVLIPNQGMGVIFQDDSTIGKTKLSPVNAGKILSAVIGLKLIRTEDHNKVIDRNVYLPLYFFVDQAGVIQRCTASTEKMQVLHGSCNALGGILTYDGCRAAVFESCARTLNKAQYTNCSQALARKPNLALVEYSPILGDDKGVFCRMEKLMKEEISTIETDLCP